MAGRLSLVVRRGPWLGVAREHRARAPAPDAQPENLDGSYSAGAFRTARNQRRPSVDDRLNRSSLPTRRQAGVDATLDGGRAGGAWDGQPARHKREPRSAPARCDPREAQGVRRHSAGWHRDQGAANRRADGGPAARSRRLARRGQRSLAGLASRLQASDKRSGTPRTVWQQPLAVAGRPARKPSRASENAGTAGAMWSTMQIAARRSTGKPSTTRLSASTPPAEAPITTKSRRPPQFPGMLSPSTKTAYAPRHRAASGSSHSHAVSARLTARANGSGLMP